MFDLYINIKNSLIGLESALRVAVSNANNFNTPGFKYTSTSFTTVYSEALSSGTRITNPVHLGSSMILGATTTDWAQGNISIGSKLDTAITGEGLYILSASDADFSAGAPKVYTRNGRLQADPQNKYLTDAFGRKVFGFKVNSMGNPTSNSLVPIETNGETDIGFIQGGILVSNWTAAQTDPSKAKPLYRLALTTFQNKQGLVQTNGGAYKATVSTGESLGLGVAGSRIGTSTNTYGDILPKSIESANIDVARAAYDMRILDRAFPAVQGSLDNVTNALKTVMKILGG